LSIADAGGYCVTEVVSLIISSFTASKMMVELLWSILFETGGFGKGISLFRFGKIDLRSVEFVKGNAGVQINFVFSH
jgi:hypothetical protein